MHEKDDQYSQILGPYQQNGKLQQNNQQQAQNAWNQNYLSGRGIKIGDNLMSQLFARGLLEDVTLKCLDESTSLLRPLINQDNTKANNLKTTQYVAQMPEQVHIQLPKLKKIEDVLQQNRDRVFDHLLKNKREAKEEFKSEQRMIRNEVIDHKLNGSIGISSVAAQDALQLCGLSQLPLESQLMNQNHNPHQYKNQMHQSNMANSLVDFNSSNASTCNSSSNSSSMSMIFKSNPNNIPDLTNQPGQFIPNLGFYPPLSLLQQMAGFQQHQFPNMIPNFASQIQDLQQLQQLYQQQQQLEHLSRQQEGNQTFCPLIQQPSNHVKNTSEHTQMKPIQDELFDFEPHFDKDQDNQSSDDAHHLNATGLDNQQISKHHGTQDQKLLQNRTQTQQDQTLITNKKALNPSQLGQIQILAQPTITKEQLLLTHEDNNKGKSLKLFKTQRSEVKSKEVKNQGTKGKRKQNCMLRNQQSDKKMSMSKDSVTSSKQVSYDDFLSRSQTESEDQSSSHDTEDLKYEKILKRKSLQTQSSRSDFENPKRQKSDSQSSQAHDSKSPQTISARPKRSAALKSLTYTQQYSGGFGSSGKHDHSHYSLVQYQNYKSYSQQPYLVYLSIEVLIMLNIHSHLSESEVIGFLGGYCYESMSTNQKYLLIDSVYPCDSLVQDQRDRYKNVELCPISADLARQKLQGRGQQLLGWYHSHPFFPVEPSQIDIRNHAVYQKSFDVESLPFVALIIGPYSIKNRTESLLKIFHLVNDKIPYSLNYKQLPCLTLHQNLLSEIEELFVKYSDHQDRINLKEQWTATKSREDKLIQSIEQIFDRNTSSKSRLQAFEKDLLGQLREDDRQVYQVRSTLNQRGQSNRYDGCKNQSQDSEHNKHDHFEIDDPDAIESFVDQICDLLEENLYGSQKSNKIDQNDNFNNNNDPKIQRNHENQNQTNQVENQSTDNPGGNQSLSEFELKTIKKER